MSNFILPEGVSVFIVFELPWYKQTHSKYALSCKISQGRFLERLINANKGPEFRLLPVSSKLKYTQVQPDVAWAEGLTLKEFEEYLND